MNFLITGAAGFLGSSLANHLAREGHQVRGLDDLSTGDPQALAPDVHFTRGDVSDRPKLWTLNQSCNTITFWGLNVPNVTSVGMLSVYPNPAQSNLNMDLNLNEGGNVVVKVVDVTGRTVLTENKGTLNAGEHRLNINTSSLENGVYIYQLMVNSEMTTGRFSIAK